MLRGACLCGAVTFEFARAIGPFELCHCNRCRKSSGSAFMASLCARTEDFRWLSGLDQVQELVLPVVETPPAYRRSFCRVCGCCLPEVSSDGTVVGIPAGLIEGDPGIAVERHIYVEHRVPWAAGLERLPDFTKEQIREFRRRGPGD